MRLTLIFSFFIFLNFMLILLPKMMPNVISIEQTLFWVFWVNGLFVLTLILPAKSSYIFESMSKAKLVTEAISEQFFGKKEPKGDEAESANETPAAANQDVQPSAPSISYASNPPTMEERIIKRKAARKGKEGGTVKKAGTVKEGRQMLNSEDRVSIERVKDIYNKTQVGNGKYLMKGGSPDNKEEFEERVK